MSARACCRLPCREHRTIASAVPLSSGISKRLPLLTSTLCLMVGCPWGSCPLALTWTGWTRCCSSWDQSWHRSWGSGRKLARACSAGTWQRDYICREVILTVLLTAYNIVTACFVDKIAAALLTVMTFSAVPAVAAMPTASVPQCCDGSQPLCRC